MGTTIQSPFDLPVGSTHFASSETVRDTKRFVYNNRREGLAGNEHKLTSFLPAYNLSAIWEHYAWMRFVGYFFQGVYSPMVRNNQHIGWEDRRQDDIWNTCTKYIDNTIGAMLGKEQEFARQNVHAISSKGLVNLTETIVFLAVSGISYLADRKAYTEYCAGAVAAERGRDPFKLQLNEIWKSENPVVTSLKHRHWWQYVARVSTDLSFLLGVNFGIVAKSLDITFERTIFETHSNDISYDKIVRLVKDVQVNNYDSNNLGNVTEDVTRILQQIYRDHRRPTLKKTQVEALKPVLDSISDGIMAHQLGVNEMVYVMGHLSKHPYEVQEMQDFVAMVKDKGLLAIARETAQQKYGDGVTKNYTLKMQREMAQSSPEVAAR